MDRGHGWIKIHRDLKDHWIFANAEYLKAWIQLLMMANHKTKKWLVQDQMVLIKRGELITSLAELAKQWGWSRGKVRRYITMLENDTMVVRKSTHLWTHLTICNYATYQDLRPTDSTTDGQQTVQLTDSKRDNQRTQLKKDKKDKKVKNVKKVKNGVVEAAAPTLLSIFGGFYLEYTGVEYHASFGKDGKILQELEKQYGFDPVAAGIGFFFQEYIKKDTFAKKNPNVGMLRNTWNGMIAMASERNRNKKQYDDWANE